MTDHLVSPDRQVTIGKQTYTLDGSFKTLKAIQHAFGKDILFVQAGVLDMRQDEIARLVALASGAPEDEIGQGILDEYDVTGADYQHLKMELLAWLAVAMSPKRDREKKRQAMQEVIDRLTASRGGSTSGSASDASAGPPTPSGEATSGK